MVVAVLHAQRQRNTGPVAGGLQQLRLELDVQEGVRGALIGAGAAVKVWPVTLLAGMPPGQQRRGIAAAAAVLAAVCAFFAGGTASFVAHQKARGVEIESVAATPFMIGRQAGWHGTVVFRFGAYQLSGAHVALAQDASGLGLILATAAVLGWQLLIASGRARWRPEFAADAPLAATLLFLVASPVLSPQYLLWVTGLAAACLATGRTTQRPVALAVLAAAGLTQLIFPVGWARLLHGSDLVTGVLAARNILLVLAAALSCWRITSVTSPSHEDPNESSSGTAAISVPGSSSNSSSRAVVGFSRTQNAHSSARLGALRPAVWRRDYHANARHGYEVASFGEVAMRPRGGLACDAEPL